MSEQTNRQTGGGPKGRRLMFLLNTLKGILEGTAPVEIWIHWLEEKHQYTPGVNLYIKRLCDPKNVRICTLIDIVAKFGTKTERSSIRKIIKKFLNKKIPLSRGAARSFIRYFKLSLYHSEFIHDLLSNLS